MTTPDKWMIIEIKGSDPHYSVFGSWFGGYLGSDSWRISSGITKCEYDSEADCFLLHGTSGSLYKCHADAYGASSYGYNVASQYMERLKPDFQILDNNHDWLKFNWQIPTPT